jgi:hypothetical protein
MIRPFTDADVDAAAEMLAQRHSRHREKEPLLPADVDFRAQIERKRLLLVGRVRYEQRRAAVCAFGGKRPDAVLARAGSLHRGAEFLKFVKIQKRVVRLARKARYRMKERRITVAPHFGVVDHRRLDAEFLQRDQRCGRLRRLLGAAGTHIAAKPFVEGEFGIDEPGLVDKFARVAALLVDVRRRIVRVEREEVKRSARLFNAL